MSHLPDNSTTPILIFGGTTEGRLAVDVCEEAGKPFFYSTKSDSQKIEMHSGKRISGAMNGEEIRRFCEANGVRCIIDAAHPFAENLHGEIAKAGLPVVRLQRAVGKRIEGVTYCVDFDDAIAKLSQAGVSRLLALSGANTIKKLRPYWQDHPTVFRILNRDESREIARSNGLPAENIIYYNDHLKLPTIEEEKETLRVSGCDAMITKESGENGGFENKVRAAKEMGVRVFVVERPRPSPYPFLSGRGVDSTTSAFLAFRSSQLGCEAPVTVVTTPRPERRSAFGRSAFSAEKGPGEGPYFVTGRHGLRRAIEEIVPEFFPLKTGLTTGACATAAAKAAAISLLSDDFPEEVAFALPDGEVLTVPVMCQERGVATVVKPDNDDPDVTKGCRITAQVCILTSEINKGDSKELNDNNNIDGKTNHNFQFSTLNSQLSFLPGVGVGTVTLPGLGIEVGEPAINPTPRRMIEAEIRALTDAPVTVRISVENGEEIAKRTFNHKVGVVGGISIIGTSGIVKPLSNEAFVESIRRELQVARALGCTEVGLVSGMKSERWLQEAHVAAGKPALRCVHYGNFVGESLKICHEMGFRKVIIGIMIGKAVKLAEGHLDTHSHKVAMNKAFLSSLCPEYAERIEGITMARELCDFMPATFFEQLEKECYKHCQRVFTEGELEVILIKN